MRVEFKLEINDRYGTQAKASEALDINPAQLSGLIHGRDPNWNETKKLLTVFSASELKKFFPRRRLWIEKMEGAKAVNQ